MKGLSELGWGVGVTQILLSLPLAICLPIPVDEGMRV